MTNQYQDKVDRTFELYRLQIKEAIEQLNREYVDSEWYKPLKIGNNGINCNFVQAKLLEQRIIELTGDPEARIMRMGPPSIDPSYSNPSLGVRPAKRVAEKDK